MRDPRNRESPPLAAVFGLGLLLAVAVLVPVLGGLWLDGRLHTAPLGVVAGVLVGIVAAVCVLYTRFKRYW